MEEKKEMVMEKDLIGRIKPDYYNSGEISCIDAMVSAFGREATTQFCKINAFKYLWRLGHKDDEAQEVGKIKWYLDKYLELKKVKETKDADKLKETTARLKREGLSQKQIDNILEK